MMNKLAILLILVLFTFLLLTPSHPMNTDINNKLSGYIELLLNRNSIKSICLTTGNLKDILDQERSNYIYSFDNTSFNLYRCTFTET